MEDLAFLSIVRRVGRADGACAHWYAMKSTLSFLMLLGACGTSGTGPDTTGVDTALVDVPLATRTVFVIPMENESASAIYGDVKNAPYLNGTLMPMAAYATSFTDSLPKSLPSEPHYVWLEAGTNKFSDKTFTNDDNASASNSTASTAHLSTQLEEAGLGWMSYQEGMTEGTCPITSISSTKYAAKHDPFVFFQDVAGSPPSAASGTCISHHKPYSSFASDLANGQLPAYVFITPNLCNDMHGASGCPSGSNVKTGDSWLASQMPAIIDYAYTHDSVIYIVWDEGSDNQTIPFLALGPHVKAGASTTNYTHSSILKSVEQQLGVDPLPTVDNATTFEDLFKDNAGYLATMP